jgi:TolB-like protein/Tfp pilus assembly protein PilF
LAATLAAAAAAGVFVHRRMQPGRDLQTVAVIPYASTQGGADTAYLADGIGEGLIDALTQVPGVQVTARSSSYRFRGEQIDARRAARQLDVRLLVLLSVARAGEQLRVTVDLVSAEGKQIWIQTYRPAHDDLAGLEAGISSEIAQRVGANLSQLERARMARTARVKPEAYDRLLRGRYQQRLYTLDSLKRAAAFYEQAAAMDPAFALAHAELANVYRHLSGSGAMNAAEMLPQAEAAARRALAADGELAEGHAALADVRKDRWDWATAENEYRRALELNPNLAPAHQGYAIFLGVRGRHDAAIAEIQRGLDLDPLGLPMALHSGAVYYNARRFNDALKALRRANSLDPHAPGPWGWMGMANAAAGRYAEAVGNYQRAAALGDSSAATMCYYAYALARSGRRDEAARLFERIRETQEFVPPSTLAIASLGLRQREDALRFLQSAYEQRDPLLQYLFVEPHFDDLRNHPAFLALAAAIGLPRR